ncbi:hypothetical protein C5167_000792 [Papaver somniferum]|uniref:C2H2-type domain-containing protein n=1 Tax=Papaver somniferum TaxID=3469 RepID=A0A4Y7KTN9_PAPSO|nr:transcriptional regulator SUPERMAN-like [Papaver somniferum]RZC76703.1 hypothetical protein C5167_000792 [Papaver somniferum]
MEKSKFSWPPRPYTCSFCKREFRSCQALGGHMNVHRRDRARLNQSIPWVDMNQYQHDNFIIPNPNFHPSCSTNAFTNHHFPPAYPPTFAYFLTSSTTPPSIIACSSSTPPPSTDENIREKSSSTIFISSSSFSQSSSTKRSTTLPMMDMSLEVGDQHQLEDFMNENDNHHQYYGSNNNVKIHGENVRLDLEIGLCSEDDLDLELRLGLSA